MGNDDGNSSTPDTSDIDIYNMSYGTAYGTKAGSSYLKFNYPSLINSSLQTTLLYAMQQRGGKGAVIAKSMGNAFGQDPTNGDSCGESGVDAEGVMSCSDRLIDTYHSLPYVIGVGALDVFNVKTTYSDVGSEIWVSGYGGEFGRNVEWLYPGEGYPPQPTWTPALMSTDPSSCSKGSIRTGQSNNNPFDGSGVTSHPENPNCNYTSSMNGTSAAAPSIAGSLALILEANPNLTWRDVKHIIANTAAQVDTSRAYTRSEIVQYEWETNGAGYTYHNWYGFGVMDVAAAVTMAKSYSASTLGEFKISNWIYDNDSDSITIASNASTAIVVTIDASDITASSNFLEFIRLALAFDHDIPRDIGIELTSPQGTTLNIIQPFTNVAVSPNYNWTTKGINGFYGEQIIGDWTLTVTDYTNDGVGGTFAAVAMEIYGH